MAITDTQVEQLIINVGTKAQIEAAIEAGTITENMLSIVTDETDFAETDSPEFSDVPTAPTATKGTNTTQINTTAFVQTAIGDKVDANAAITGATKCKITYDSKGLVTADADLVASDIPNLSLSKITDVTATAAEVNVLDGITATTAELNILDGVTADASEINILDGVAATTAELNVLDGITATTTELNYVDGVTSNIQTQLDNKVIFRRFS